MAGVTKALPATTAWITATSSWNEVSFRIYSATPRILNALPNGYVLQGRYVIEAQLGSGGFGITYLAKHRYLEDIWVAIKGYLTEGAAVRDSSSRVHAISEQRHKIYAWGLRRFLDEARLLCQFKHPNIDSIEDFFEANNTAYLVMNDVHGRSIQADQDAGRKFDKATLRGIVYTLLKALNLIHCDGLYHRDISPTISCCASRTTRRC